MMKIFLIFALIGLTLAQSLHQFQPPQTIRLWRDPINDTRCPASFPEVTEFPVILPQLNNAFGFIMCFGPNRGWPFNCPPAQIFDSQLRVCVDQVASIRFPYYPQQFDDQPMPY
jgi:hypothetical protein